MGLYLANNGYLEGFFCEKTIQIWKFNWTGEKASNFHSSTMLKIFSIQTMNFKKKLTYLLLSIDFRDAFSVSSLCEITVYSPSYAV